MYFDNNNKKIERDCEVPADKKRIRQQRQRRSHCAAAATLQGPPVARKLTQGALITYSEAQVGAICLSLSLSLSPHPRTFFPIASREREKHRCEREALIGCLPACWDQGSYVTDQASHGLAPLPGGGAILPPRYWLWRGIERATFGSWDNAPTTWATSARAGLFIFKAKVEWSEMYRL